MTVLHPLPSWQNVLLDSVVEGYSQGHVVLTLYYELRFGTWFPC